MKSVPAARCSFGSLSFGNARPKVLSSPATCIRCHAAPCPEEEIETRAMGSREGRRPTFSTFCSENEGPESEQSPMIMRYGSERLEVHVFKTPTR